ncbi:MAG TPA: hypothetical protein VLH56_07280 [Dissulfurispiraceae bacterium]|nr:hypothetical protein [Dissulfurispiraceae bacterium]
MRAITQTGRLSEHARHYPQLPGGVGPLTIALLMHNAVQAAKQQSSLLRQAECQRSGSGVLPVRHSGSSGILPAKLVPEYGGNDSGHPCRNKRRSERNSPELMTIFR